MRNQQVRAHLNCARVQRCKTAGTARLSNLLRVINPITSALRNVRGGRRNSRCQLGTLLVSRCTFFGNLRGATHVGVVACRADCLIR